MRLALVVSLTLASPATAMELAGSIELPFYYHVASLKEEVAGERRYTTVTVELKNGGIFFVKSASFHCLAKNKDGYRWRVTGNTYSIQREELRTVKLVSEGETEPYTNAISVTCLVSGFETPGF